MARFYRHATSRDTLAMNAPTAPSLPEVLLGSQPADQPNLELAAESVRHYVWQSAYGAMLIEVRDGAAFVNGERVTSIQELQVARAGALFPTLR